MKIVLVNTTDTKGGAAVACGRLLNALNNNNISAKLLVKDKFSSNGQVIATRNTQLKKFVGFLRFVTERIIFAIYEKSKAYRFAFSLANTGEDISRHPLIKEADIIHLHWINFGFLSLKSLKKLIALEKPIVWTMHDMWSFTGGCHYSGDCNNFATKCSNCVYLKNRGENDLSNKIFGKKLNLFKNANISFVGCSRWLKQTAEQSKIINKHHITNIPNPIDTKLFSPDDKNKWRKHFNLPLDKKLILFGAANINDKRKGYSHLVSALDDLKNGHPSTLNRYELVVFGKAKDLNINLPYKVHQLPYISEPEEIAGIYNSADVFVLPSLEDNLPNTIMEALACGVPVVAFNVGGIPEMIKHRITGYISSFKSATNLANGIYFVLHNDEYEQLSENARKFVLENYSEHKIAEQYFTLYQEVKNNRNNILTTLR